MSRQKPSFSDASQQQQQQRRQSPGEFNYNSADDDDDEERHGAGAATRSASDNESPERANRSRREDNPRSATSTSADASGCNSEGEENETFTPTPPVRKNTMNPNDATSIERSAEREADVSRQREANEQDRAEKAAPTLQEPPLRVRKSAGSTASNAKTIAVVEPAHTANLESGAPEYGRQASGSSYGDNSSVVVVGDAEVQRIAAETERIRSERARSKTAADTLHNVFLYLSIPSAIIVGCMAIGLYVHDDVHAVTASRGVAGFCTACSVILTGFLIFLHMTVYTNPTQQRYIIRILLMVPIYAIDSYLALVAYEYGTIIGLVRDSYEAYLIYTFFALLLDYLGGEDNVLLLWKEHSPGEMKHMFPMNLCFAPMKLNSFTFTVWKVCLVQYMVLNPLLTMITVPLYFTGTYEEGAFSPGNSYPYFAAIRFVSVSFAFTSLVYFFFATKDFLTPHKPLAKFAAIKAVVFFCFWQSVLIAILHHFGVIPHGSEKIWTSDRVATGLQNFIICIEMYIACLAHRWIFTDEPYMPLSGRLRLHWWVVLHAFSVSDVIHESHEALLLSPKTLFQMQREEREAKQRGASSPSAAQYSAVSLQTVSS